MWPSFGTTFLGGRRRPKPFAFSPRRSSRSSTTRRSIPGARGTRESPLRLRACRTSAEGSRDSSPQQKLENAHVLEVGSGAGTLQDIVPDYTGLDISAGARAKYHK